MPRKIKFRPRMTRVGLNPEQAVLACNCFSGGMRPGSVGARRWVCTGKPYTRWVLWPPYGVGKNNATS